MLRLTFVAFFVVCAVAAANPTLRDFSFRLGHGRVLKCSVVIGLAGDPDEARCDGFIGATQGAVGGNGGVVGGDRRILLAARRRCQRLAESSGDGMAVGGLIVNARGHGRISCVGDAESGGPYLRVGHSIAAGPFRCVGLRTGLRCVAWNQHGFFFGLSTWRTF